MTNIILKDPPKKVNNSIIQFIESNIKLIESNDFNQLYDIAGNKITISPLTSVLTQADIEILNYIESIPDMFLMDQHVSSVVIPSTVKHVGAFAFDGTYLRKVDFSNADHLELIGTSAFSSTHLNEVILPSNLIHIDSYVFANTPFLTTLYVPSSVMSIGSFCFQRSTLQKLVYGGTQTEFDYLVTQSPSWNSNSILKEVICSDGVILLDGSK